jgi:hypothetical protein
VTNNVRTIDNARGRTDAVMVIADLHLVETVR